MPRTDPVSRLLYRLNTRTAGSCSTMVKRERPVQVTVGDANLRPKTPKKGVDWMYVGGKVQRAESVMINGTKYTDPREPSLPRRKIESNFFLTINTNLSPDPEHEDDCVFALRKTLEQLRKPATLCSILKFGPVDAVPYASDKYADVIESVEWKGECEFGPSLGRLHAHVWVTFNHYSQIQFNSSMLQHKAREFYNEHVKTLPKECHIRKLPYVHVKLLPQSDWATIMRQYIHKAMTSPPE